MFLGELEKKVMDILWKNQGSVSVRTVMDELNASQTKHYAYTTVMTTLVRLHQKDIVKRKSVGRGFEYIPLQSQSDFLTSMSKQVIDGVAHQFGDVAVAHFVEALAQVDERNVKKWKSILDNHV